MGLVDDGFGKASYVVVWPAGGFRYSLHSDRGVYGISTSTGAHRTQRNPGEVDRSGDEADRSSAWNDKRSGGDKGFARSEISREKIDDVLNKLAELKKLCLKIVTPR